MDLEGWIGRSLKSRYFQDDALFEVSEGTLFHVLFSLVFPAILGVPCFVQAPLYFYMAICLSASSHGFLSCISVSLLLQNHQLCCIRFQPSDTILTWLDWQSFYFQIILNNGNWGLGLQCINFEVTNFNHNLNYYLTISLTNELKHLWPTKFLIF